ncbi:MAG: S1 RNA-binding domain-containing protein [Lachnospiraceae bacterium]|nr:S1 RNA-binding domain-containing protein [Lachnospiraceae bacterium]
MLELGKKQTLVVVKEVEFGVYLAEKMDSEEKVLLPKKQMPKDIKVSDSLEVFLYKDSSDRMIATTREPKISLGNLAVLKVKELSKIGAFLDWGLEKDLLLPFKEQLCEVKAGKSYLVCLYVDKSSRLCATMKVYSHLKNNSSYMKDDMVQGIVYEVTKDFGVYVAVDNLYSARIPSKEVYDNLKVGDVIEARVSGVKADGKLDLSMRQKAYMQMDADAEFILAELTNQGGMFPFTDKTVEPEHIKTEFHMSKNAFKRAVGNLLKAGKIQITSTSICLKDK